MIVVAPCDEALYQSSVLLLVVFVGASNNGGVIRKLLVVAGTRAEMEVCGVDTDLKGTAIHTDILRPALIQDAVGVQMYRQKLFAQKAGLNGLFFVLRGPLMSLLIQGLLSWKQQIFLKGTMVSSQKQM